MLESKEFIDIQKILKWLPHRYPMLLVDRVLSVTPGEVITALKNVSINEHFFNGHFPQYPIMPGVLIIEALAQTAGLLAAFSDKNCDENKLYLLASVNHARFKKPVIPGDTLILSAQFKQRREGFSCFITHAKVNEELVARVEITCAIR